MHRNKFTKFTSKFALSKFALRKFALSNICIKTNLHCTMSGQSDIMNECDMDFVDLEEGDLKMGLTFSNEDIAMKSN